MTKLITIVAILAVGLVAGCGSDTKSSNDYVKAVNKAQNDFVASINKLNTSTSASNGATDTFKELDAAITKVIADLKAVKPPSKVSSLHSDLVAELGDFKSAVSTAGQAIGSKDPHKIAAAQAKFGSAASATATKLGNTITEINKKLQG